MANKQSTTQRHAREGGHPGLEARLEAIEYRNQKVESDKAWETSLTRRITISVITYITACFILSMILIPNWYLVAIVPVCGYWLSTLSLPMVRIWWQSGK
ncbi:MAG: hypothetical protein WAZ18_07120 [Alphaproteobacteria bacterium]